MQRRVLNRFRRQVDAENYLQILRRYAHDRSLLIVFDPPGETIGSCESQEIDCRGQHSHPSHAATDPNETRSK